jgi:1-acyl-sn-glycerol-3-phosphate acyltransferase
MLRSIYRFLFNLFGWKITGNFPPGLRKYIIAVAPHTSNWDFPVGLAARSILRIEDAKFLGKSQLFKPPVGWFFRAIGGYPVERTTSHDMVNQVVKLFNNHDDFILAIAPEGTRKKVEKLKTGFYYIAKSANIPIIPVGFDFGKKAVIVGDPLYPSDDFDADIETLYSFYRNITGKNPALGLGSNNQNDESVKKANK